MSTLQIIFIISFVLFICGFIGYTYEFYVGRVMLWTEWHQLTKRQWIYFCMSSQFLVTLVFTVLYLIFE